MKSLMFALVMLFTCTIAQAQWTQEFRIDEDSLNAYTSSRIGLTDVPVVLFGNSLGELYVRRLETDRSGEWNHLTLNTPLAFITDWASSEMHCSGQNVALVFKDKNQQKGHTRLVVSRDGGRTYADPIEIINGDSVLHRFPNVLVSDTSIFVSFMHFEENFLEPEYQVMKLNRQGIVEKVYTIENPDGEACDCCTSHLIEAGGQVGVLFRNNLDNVRDMHLAILDPLLDEFSKPMDINAASWEIFACPSTSSNGMIIDDLAIIPHISGHEGNRRIYLSVVNHMDRSIVLERPLLQSNSNRIAYDNPKISGNQDTIGVVWQETASGRTTLYFSYSTDGTDSLGMQKMRVSTDSTSRLVNPSITFEHGVFHFTWSNNSRGSVLYRTFKVPVTTSTNSTQQEITNNLLSNLVRDRLVFKREIKEGLILDMNGRVQMEICCESINALISKLNPGSYILKSVAKGTNQEIVERFIKL